MTAKGGLSVAGSQDDLLPDERPIEKLLRGGPEALTTVEVVALLIGRSVREARALLRNGVEAFAQQDWMAKASRRGLTRAVRITMALELAKRVAQEECRIGEPVDRAEKIGKPLVAAYGAKPREHFIAVFLDSKNNVILQREIYRGTINFAYASTREPMRLALNVNAKALIVAHNHPSGSTCPSPEDIGFTKRLIAAAKLFDITILDHLILTRKTFLSMRRERYIKEDKEDLEAGLPWVYH